MNDTEKALLCELQNGFKLESRPFKRIANTLKLSEDRVIEVIKKFCDNGVIRRIGVAVRAEKLGETCNALVAWKVAESEVEKVGGGFTARREISHCYDRECPDGWPFNLFTMIHARSTQQLEQIIDECKAEFNLSDYKIFKTERELKKTSMKYFSGAADADKQAGA